MAPGNPSRQRPHKPNELGPRVYFRGRWAGADRLARCAGRAAQRARLDEAVAAWLGQRSSREAMEALQAAGVPAGAMLRVVELPQFKAFQARQFFQTFRQAGLDVPVLVDNAPVQAERLARPPLSSAPRMGQHTREIAHDVLGLSDAEIDRLFAAKVLEGR